MRDRTRRMTIAGHGLTDRTIRRGLRINIIAGMLGMSFVAMTQGIPLTMLMEALGVSGVLIGLIVTVQQLAMLVQIPAALYVERLPIRKTAWAILALTHRALWFLPALLPLLLAGSPRTVAWAVVGAVALSALLMYGATPAWFSWMADLVPANISGRFWGKRQSFTMGAYLLCMGLAGALLDWLSGPQADGSRSFAGFSIVFALAAVVGMVDIFIHLWVPEPVPIRTKPAQPVLRRLAAPLRQADFRWLTFSAGAWMFALGMVGSFGSIYLKRSFGATYTQLSVISISAAVGTVITSPVMGYLIDRVGARALSMILLFAAPCFGFVWFFVSPTPVTLPLPGIDAVVVPQPILVFTVTNLAAGSLFGGIGLCQINLLNAIVPKTGRTVAMAVHWSIVGLMAAFGPVVGGLVFDSFGDWGIEVVLPLGAPLAFHHVLVLMFQAVCWFGAIPMRLKVRPRDGELPVGGVLSRLSAGNPLRSLGNVFNIYLISAAVSSKYRARAARKLGEGRTAVASTDLIEKLDDPSYDVREEAALALGRIGSPEAIDALIAKLEDPYSDLAPQITRALRQSPDPRSVEALVHQLHMGDRETRTESARALGAIGDPRAAGSLLDIVRRTNDDKILSASAEALARLGELTALYEIIPRMKMTRNPVLRRSMAVAAADLLGEPERFYKVLNAETETPGDQIETMLKALRKAIRRAADDHDAARVLCGLSRRLELAYLEEQFQEAANVLVDLAMGMAALVYQLHAGSTHVMVDELVWHDEKFAIGLWYLDLLRQHWDEADFGPRDRIDILLGIYFLDSRRRHLNRERKRNLPPPGNQRETA